jgi:hypothetical protein
MSKFLQTVIPAALTALVAGQAAITRTIRLRRLIRANVDLLGTLPADHPSRATLEPTSASWSTYWSGDNAGGSRPSRRPGCCSASTSPSPP